MTDLATVIVAGSIGAAFGATVVALLVRGLIVR